MAAESGIRPCPNIGFIHEHLLLFGLDDSPLPPCGRFMAMEGKGPVYGDLVKMDLIIAGTNPLATDMVTADIMGFQTNEIPIFAWANKSGMRPERLDEIEIRGEKPGKVSKNFTKPYIMPWYVARYFSPKCSQTKKI